MIFRLKLCICILLLLSFVMDCSKNPLFDDNKIVTLGTNKISGKVQLSDGTTPDNVFVWLEGVNISTTTNNQGEFQLFLYGPNEIADENLSGAFNVYYYLGNYTIDSSRVAISKGSFIFGQGDVNDDGEIGGVITLHKIVGISITLRASNSPSPLPGEVIEDPLPGSDLMAQVKITSYAEGAQAKIFQEQPGQILGYYIRNVEDPIASNAIWAGNKVDLHFTHIGQTIELLSEVFKVGGVAQYEFIPYIEVKQAGLKEELILAIMQSDRWNWTGYSKIPYKRDGDRFEVVNRQIIGHVDLSDGENPSRVYVWFKCMNLDESTSGNGDFRMILPPRSQQPGGALHGDYDLYFYVGNYRIGKVLVNFQNGGTEEGSSVSITLDKLLDIRTTLSDSIVYCGDEIQVAFYLSPVCDPVDVEIFLMNNHDLDGIFIYRSISNASIISHIGFSLPTIKNISETEVFYAKIKVPATLELGGRYKVVPYVFVIQDNIPPLLLNSIGPYARWIHTDYLRIPFKRKDWYFMLE